MSVHVRVCVFRLVRAYTHAYTGENVPLCLHEVNKCVRQHSSIHPIRCSSTRFIHTNFNKPILRVEIENVALSESSIIHKKLKL